jgi:tetratricopeptide (TPR) repeat protein
MYVPMIGIAVAVSWECGERWGQSREGSRALIAAAACVLAVFAVVARRQIAVWQDGVTLFTHAIDVTSDNFVAHDNLGIELDKRGRHEEALEHYRETLRIKPGDAYGEENYAQATFQKGERLFTERKFDEAVALFHEGLRHRPNNAMAHTYAGLILREQGQLPAAMTELRQALRLDPKLARAHLGLAVALAYSGDAAGAVREFEQAAADDPTNVEARYDLGITLTALGRPGDAVKWFEAALAIQPKYGDALAGKAAALFAERRYDEAWSAVESARAANTQVDPALVAAIDGRRKR